MEKSRLARLIPPMLLAVLAIGCAEGAGDRRRSAPAQPGNSATIGVDYGKLPRGRMYIPVPGTDLVRPSRGATTLDPAASPASLPNSD